MLVLLQRKLGAVLEVEGAQLFVVEVGAGPPVVLLHGGPGASHDYLRPQMDALAGDVASRPCRRLVYYDQRGSGRSPLAPGRPPGTASDHVADLDRLRAHLGEGRLRLVGYSWGGLLALLYALEHPRSVERLALISPAPARARERAVAQTRLEAAQRRPEVDALKRSLPAPLDRRARFALAVAGYFADPRRALELTPFLVKQAAEQAVWRSLGDYDLRPGLSTLELPALIVHGALDPIPLESSRLTAQALGAELVELEHCGHVPYVEAPAPLLAALNRFLID